MAIRLKVQQTNVHFKIRDGDAKTFTAQQGVPIYPTTYAGTYTVTPTQNTQTLETAGLMMTGNVTINPIPSNYGLITWDGSTLTVS